LKLKIIEQKENRVKFDITGINTQLANALRRTIISGIPVLAVERVKFLENSSVMHDEVLAHRIGLIPLKTDKGTPEIVTLSLDTVKGPGTVYAKDLNPGLAVYGKIPLVSLDEGQELKFEAEAILGTARDHVKWQAGLASYSKNDDGSYDFFVESYGQMAPKYLILTAVSTLKNQLEEFKAAIQEK